jgi:hypothetical protein
MHQGVQYAETKRDGELEIAVDEIAVFKKKKKQKFGIMKEESIDVNNWFEEDEFEALEESWLCTGASAVSHLSKSAAKEAIGLGIKRMIPAELILIYH